MKALVVFHDHGAHLLDRWLKPGFRHCFVAVAVDRYWILIDGMAGVPEVKVPAGADHDLADFYRTEGFTVVETHQRQSPPSGPIVASNCVGMVKVILAITAPLVQTPYALFRYLLKETGS